MTIQRFGAFIAAVFLLAAPAVAQESKSRVTPAPQPPSSLDASVATGDVSPEPVRLSLGDAIQRALKANVAILNGSQDTRLAAAAHERDLSDLMPKINGHVTSIQQQIDLAAFGFGGFPGIAQIIGPFSLLDARATLSQSIVNFQRLHNFRETSEIEKASDFSNRNTRELVILAVTNLYFQSVAAASRTTAVDAQVVRAQALFTRAGDMRSAGTIPGIDVLRSQVELQSQQQRLIQARSDFERSKLDLARAIGLPLGQSFMLTDSLPSGSSSIAPIEELLARAWSTRLDVKEAESRLRAAEEAVKASRAENLPTVGLEADYGAIGRTPGNSHGTYSVSGVLRFPIFNSDSKTDTMKNEALADRRRVEVANLHGSIEHDVRSAVLDVHSAEEQLKVAQSALELVRQQLDQSQDRFSAGVADNLEVVQAQEALALADEHVIASLYGFNVARVLLARAMGIAEQSIQEFLGGNTR